MRQRAIAGKDRILQECGEYLVKDVAALRGRWRSLYEGGADRPLHLEIGSGKGQFITALAEAHPDIDYLACEGGTYIYIRILQKAKELGLANLKVLPFYLHDPCEIFSDGEIDRLYLNFSDPCPKKRHAKRRLTHRRYLAQYRRIASPGAELFFKTDNDDLFAFSLEEFEAEGLPLLARSDDLWNSPYAEDNVPTEYEERFARGGKTIHYARVKLR